MKRVMCVWLPDWPLQRIRYALPEHKNRALVLHADAGRRGFCVVACCPRAVRRGVAPGMPLAEARGLLGTPYRSPGAALFLPHEPERDAAALRKLAVWSQRFSPIVGIEGADNLLLDLSGTAHLFGGERRLARVFSRSAESWELCVRIAIADTIGAAWAVAHYGSERTTVVPPEGQGSALDPLPVQALRLPAAAIETLDELDVRRIEQLRRLPRAALPSRFGPDVARRLDQALGQAFEGIEPIRPPDPIDAAWEFEHPLADRRSLQVALGRLVERIAEKLSTRQQAAQQLEVRLIDPDKRETVFTVGMLRPSVSVPHLTELTLTRLEQTVLPEQVAEARIAAVPAARPESHQNQLFAAGENARNDRELAQLIDRLSHRLGKDRVAHSRLQPDPQPERALSWEACLDSPMDFAIDLPAPVLPASARPLCLHPEPLAIDVTSVVPDGPPIRFFRQSHVYTVVRWWGPERIETGWWRDRHVRRDYFRVETDRGGQFWLFRQINHGNWFLHGEFE